MNMKKFSMMILIAGTVGLANANSTAIFTNYAINKVGKAVKNEFQLHSSKKLNQIDERELPNVGAEQCNYHGLTVKNKDMEHHNFHNHFLAVKNNDGKFYTMCNNKLGMPDKVESQSKNEYILIWNKVNCRYKVQFQNNRVVGKTQSCKI